MEEPKIDQKSTFRYRASARRFGQEPPGGGRAAPFARQKLEAEGFFFFPEPALLGGDIRRVHFER